MCNFNFRSVKFNHVQSNCFILFVDDWRMKKRIRFNATLKIIMSKLFSEWIICVATL